METFKTYATPVLLVILVAQALVFGALQMPGSAASGSLAVGLALVFANLEKFQKFKAAGIEAELRTAVEKTYAAIEELKELSLVLAVPIIDTMAMSGEWSSYIPLSYKIDQGRKLEVALKKLGATDAEIEAVCDTLHQRIHKLHARRVLYLLAEVSKENATVLGDIGHFNVEGWRRRDLEAYIKEKSLTSSCEVEEALLDLDHYLASKTLRRPDKWDGC